MSPGMETFSTRVFVPGLVHPNAAQGQLGFLNPKPQRCFPAGRPSLTRSRGFHILGKGL